MIYYKDIDSLDRGYRLMAMQHYLRVVEEQGFVEFSYSTSELLSRLDVQIENGDMKVEPGEFDYQLFTSDESDKRVTAHLQLSGPLAEWVNIKIVAPKPSIRLSGKPDFFDRNQSQTYRTVAAIIVSLCPMKSRLNRDDIPSDTLHAEISELTTLLQKQAHLTPENLVTVAKAVYRRREFLGKIAPVSLSTGSPFCTTEQSLDEICVAIENDARRYDVEN